MLDKARPSPESVPDSVRGKRWQVHPAVPHDVPGGVDPRAASVAAARGVADLETFFRPTIKATMPDPSTLDGMDAAVSRIVAAVRSGETIGLVGDYDVDGATSLSVMLVFLASVGHRAVHWRIPDRMVDGYGANPTLVASMHAASGMGLLLILDSGTTAFEAVDAARALGVDVVVVDHHEPSPRGLPDAVVVNPKRPGSDRKLDYLCTVGLALLLCVGLKRELRCCGHFGPGGVPEPDVRDLLGLVALGTVADVVPLVGLNRAYAHHGFRRMHLNVGVASLASVTGSRDFNAYTCGFVFGPSLNAAGRIDDMSMSVDLLTSVDPAAARATAERLHELNQARRRLTLAAVERAKEMVEAEPATHAGVIVLHEDAWHPGIVGLVAARVRELYDRPVVAIGAEGKGSCRSVDGFHIGAAVIAAAESGILVKGGGHGAAAGLTVDPARVGDLRAHLALAYEGHVAPPVHVDMELRCGEASPDLFHALESLAPFGMGNPRPRVALVGGRVKRVSVLKGVHVKVWIEDGGRTTTVMAFSSVGTPLGDALAGARGARVDVLGTLDTSTYAGVEEAVLKPEDIVVHG